MRAIRLPAVAAVLAATMLPACGLFGRPFLNLSDSLPPVSPDSIAAELFLIGDAGLPAPGGEPVLEALKKAVSWDPERSLIVFLGDNVYPAGLPDSTSNYRREAERILDAQLDVLRETGTHGIFVPGNHDWDAGGPLGWWTVVRQEHYIEEHGRGLASFRPSYGCPGPETVDYGEALRLVFLDTQWWLHEARKPQGADSPCPTKTRAEVVDSLRSTLRAAEQRAVIVMGHHPIISAGHHGGYFDWPAYIVPIYAWARMSGFANQDISSREYRAMRDALEQAFSENRPLIYAAGHEHNLQVLARRPARFLLVSGGGIYGHTTALRGITGTRYVRSTSGFMRLTVLRDGRLRLGVLVVDAAGEAKEDFSMWLTRAPTSR
jgi:hypothetical protein